MGYLQASLFRHLLTKHATILKGNEDMHSSHKQKSISAETEEGFNTAIEEQSVSSGEGGEKKQEQSCDDDIEVESSLVHRLANK